MSYLSAKPLISHSSSSSSGTQVSTAMGPVCLAGSCFLGLNALERRPFLCGVGVSTHKTDNLLVILTNFWIGVILHMKKVLPFTFRCISVFKRARNLSDTVFRADAIGTHFPSFYNFCCCDICISGF